LQKYSLVGFIILMAVWSSTEIRYLKILSLASSALFLTLNIAMLLGSGASIDQYLGTLGNVTGYFENIHRFLSPISDYHGWYLFWWFAWSIMIGQFVARFVGGLRVWQLMVALLVIPSIAIALWFATLYYYFANAIEVSSVLNAAMVIVGILFVINSLDSLIRLYTDNLALGVDRVGRGKYVLGNWLLIASLVLLYQFTPFEIEWVGLIVIGLYLVIYILLFKGRRELAESFSIEQKAD
jgi:choline-glycine betaine transporter